MQYAIGFVFQQFRADFSHQTNLHSKSVPWQRQGTDNVKARLKSLFSVSLNEIRLSRHVANRCGRPVEASLGDEGMPSGQEGDAKTPLRGRANSPLTNQLLLNSVPHGQMLYRWSIIWEGLTWGK